MSKIESIKNHVREHKKAYVIGGTVAAVGVAAGVGYILGVRTTPKDVETLVAPSNTINGLAWKPTQSIEVVVEALGDPGNVIQDTTTGVIYASQRQAARELGLDPSSIRRNVQGISEHVKGHKFQFLAKAIVPETA